MKKSDIVNVRSFKFESLLVIKCIYLQDFIILYMEESIRKLKLFFEHISKAETKADQYKTKLFTTPGAKREVFQAIDKDFKEEISSVEICHFCQERGIKVSDKNQQTIGRYFRNWNQSINYQEFSEILKPKSEGIYVEQDQIQDPIYVFLGLIDTVISSFKSLELMRQQVTQNNYCIMKHFQENYGTKKYLTKEVLKQFLINQDIYTRKKFTQISNYIFGESETKIPWSNFFFKKEGKSVKMIGTSKSIKQENQQEEQIEKSNRNGRKSCKNIQQVLSQIEEIQKNMKNRKQKQKQKPNQHSKQKTLKGSLKQSRIFEEPQKKNKVQFVGKVVSRKESKKKIEDENRNGRFSDFPEKYELFDEFPVCMETSTKQRKDYSYNKSSKHLRKSVSEAQLKIEQIQKRAMDKYLNNRKNMYLPNDGFVPYYHVNQRQNQEFCRLRKRQNYESGRIENILSRAESPRPHVFSRNKVSRGVYDIYESTGHYRPVSPRLLRY